ncbi:Predicted membrane protein [Lutibacter oricola]|uniref:Predicted membrane protein n=1 Tax=Lutibacter oricola TaxID=762486 RepID=A0A1H2RHL0_9FLAO|nr:DUF2157 domain-containing protein [Lutibacter oricola]SDW18891.1 Predicted membrane protein [Lutibacter oricola]
MNISKDLKELIDANVISTEIAGKIDSYYKSKESTSTNKLFIVFGVLGALLVGLGIILILAHNWDNLPKLIKTTLAFIPLLIGQLLCGFTLLKKSKNVAWRESSAVFLFFAVGSSISLVSQIYNIDGDIASFTITWMLLCLPLVYLLKSSVVSLLYIIGITFYAGKVGYWSYPRAESYTYWLLLLLVMPHYYLLFKNKPKSNFFIVHNWFIPLSILYALGTIANNYEEIMFVAYLSLLGIYYLVGNSNFCNNQKLRNNSYLIIGSLGTIGMLLSLSFSWYWEDLLDIEFTFNTINNFAEVIATSVLFITALVLLIKQFQKKSIKQSTLIEAAFLLFTISFFIGLKLFLPIIFINLLIFLIGILTIRKGEQKNHLGILNYGLLIITTLVVCRFFDTDLSFVLRGLLFVSVGVGFFITNYWMLKKRNKNEK